MAYLIVEGAGERRQVPIAGSVTIGRQKECGVFVDDPKLSREHTRVYFDGRVYRVQDLESKNGTFLNGQLLRDEKMLRPGDRIKIGDVVLTFALDAGDANLPPEARGVAPTPAEATARGAAPAPKQHDPAPVSPLGKDRLDTERREQIVAHAKAVSASGTDTLGAAGRALLTLLLLIIFGASTWGFRALFVWAFDRVLPK